MAGGGGGGVKQRNGLFLLGIGEMLWSPQAKCAEVRTEETTSTVFVRMVIRSSGQKLAACVLNSGHSGVLFATDGALIVV